MSVTASCGSYVSKEEWERTEKFRQQLSMRLGFIIWADIGVEYCDEARRIAERNGIDAAIVYANEKFNELFDVHREP